MITLLKNATIYAPQAMGKADILLAGGVIQAIEPDLSCWETLEQVEVTDLAGAVTVPGLIDLHVHIIGGGGEMGPISRVPELTLSQLTACGITTALGLLGTDGITRSQEALQAKARALTAEGITCLCLTGSYQYPSPTLTGSVARDIALIDPVVGVKVALSDHRASNPSRSELIRLGSDARLGGLLGGKAGLVVAHMGGGKEGMQPIFDALEDTEIPSTTFLPTHCGRNALLVSHAAQYTRQGGYADFTASERTGKTGAGAAISSAIEQGGDPQKMTISTDSGGSLPRFDGQGNCTGMGIGMPEGLLQELRRLTELYQMPLEQALAFLTQNPAAVLGLADKKGTLAPGADGDILVLGKDYTVNRLYAKGRLMVQDGQCVTRGMFE